MEMQGPPVQIPENVYEAFEFIRKEGMTNMFAVDVVQRFAHQYDYHEAVVWLENQSNRETYKAGVRRGFEPDLSMETTP